MSSGMSVIFESMEDQTLVEELAAFGISTIEARIYLYLVNKPPKSILQIAKDLNLPRTSVYDTSARLVERGLLQKMIKGKSQMLQANSLKVLQEYVDKEKSRVDDLQKQLSTLEDCVEQTETSATQNEARYYRGVQAFKQMIWNTLKAEKETIGYSQFGRFEAAGDAFYEKKIQDFIQRGLKDRVIASSMPDTIDYLMNGPYSKYRHQYQEVRVMTPGLFHIAGDTTIYNNVFSVTYWKQGEVIGVEIENSELVQTQRSIFEYLWERAEPLENYVKKKRQNY